MVPQLKFAFFLIAVLVATTVGSPKVQVMAVRDIIGMDVGVIELKLVQVGKRTTCNRPCGSDVDCGDGSLCIRCKPTSKPGDWSCQK
ncbi:hypothetical protein A4A49_37847 [Nicotiana attenuata]|uniref:Carboxypeptidase A inhibitor-like domain-containing protein n=1 Tax=Nicotiana attenuata TaxID=49451 RepID=A0A1J6KE74_NICAT|nr:hypothetical protein A4A49_37847 [Nicotiana attenuata]